MAIRRCSRCRWWPALACMWLRQSLASQDIDYSIPYVMNSISMIWPFDDGQSGWGQASQMEMGLDIDMVNGDLRGVVLPNVKPFQAYVDSPELLVHLDQDERDFLVLRMRYEGQCETAKIAVERHGGTLDPKPRLERKVFHDPTEVKFQLRPNSLQYELYFIPLWKHVTGMINRIRFYPCTHQTPVLSTRQQSFGQAFNLDWVALAKAPVIKKVRGCIDRYFRTSQDWSHPFINCTANLIRTNGYHEVAQRQCFAMDLPVASTYNCVREGGERITIYGKHFGNSDAIVTIDGVDCLDIVHTVPEVELQCTLPPAVNSLGAVSNVIVRNGRLHELYDEMPLLTYAAPVSALAVPTISNVASHALDVNWRVPSSIFERMTVTGYQIVWKLCTDTAFNEANSVVVGNVTSTTLINLDPSTGYQVKVRALTEDQRQLAWQEVDLYGRRPITAKAIQGLDSSTSSCVTTPATDVVFSSFTAYNLLNHTSATGASGAYTLGPSGEIGPQGHYGLYVNGDTNIQNCNSSFSCCDGFDANACSFVCYEIASRSSLYLNGSTARDPPTNAPFAKPFPSKNVRDITLSGMDNSTISSLMTPITSSCGPSLRLTGSRPFQTGCAWYARQMNVREGFDTTFEFRIANPSTQCKVMDAEHTNCRSRGGDGFAFVVQNDQPIGLGAGGMELGYGRLNNALSVEFDTWFNPEQLDVYENHISVHVGGRMSSVGANHAFSLGSTSTIPDLTDGQHKVRIVYLPDMDANAPFQVHFTASAYAGHFFSNGDWMTGAGLLKIYLDDSNNPVLSVPLRLDASLELNHGRAFVGFTAATGESTWQTHDILSWTFQSLRRERYNDAPAILVDNAQGH